MAPNAKDRMLLDKAKGPNFKEVSPVIRAALGPVGPNTYAAP